MPADLKALTEELAKALTESPTEVNVVEEGDEECIYLETGGSASLIYRE